MLTKNIKIMLLLIVIALLYTFVLGCEDTTISTEGKIEAWEVTGLDSAVEEMARPVLDFGDAMVDTARDTLKDTIELGYNSTQ